MYVNHIVYLTFVYSLQATASCLSLKHTCVPPPARRGYTDLQAARNQEVKRPSAEDSPSLWSLHSRLARLPPELFLVPGSKNPQSKFESRGGVLGDTLDWDSVNGHTSPSMANRMFTTARRVRENRRVYWQRR